MRRRRPTKPTSKTTRIHPQTKPPVPRQVRRRRKPKAKPSRAAAHAAAFDARIAADQYKDLIQKASIELTLGSYDDAIRWFTRAIACLDILEPSKGPTFCHQRRSDIYAHIALCHLQQDDPSAAVTSLKSAIGHAEQAYAISGSFLAYFRISAFQVVCGTHEKTSIEKQVAWVKCMNQSMKTLSGSDQASGTDHLWYAIAAYHHACHIHSDNPRRAISLLETLVGKLALLLKVYPAIQHKAFIHGIASQADALKNVIESAHLGITPGSALYGSTPATEASEEEKAAVPTQPPELGRQRSEDAVDLRVSFGSNFWQAPRKPSAVRETNIQRVSRELKAAAML